MSQSKIWVGPIVERCCDCEYNLKDLYSVYLTSDAGYHTTRSESEKAYKELVENVLANTNVSIVQGEAVKRLEASSLPPLMCTKRHIPDISLSSMNDITAESFIEVHSGLFPDTVRKCIIVVTDLLRLRRMYDINANQITVS